MKSLKFLYFCKLTVLMLVAIKLVGFYFIISIQIFFRLGILEQHKYSWISLPNSDYLWNTLGIGLSEVAPYVLNNTACLLSKKKKVSQIGNFPISIGSSGLSGQ